MESRVNINIPLTKELVLSVAQQQKNIGASLKKC